MNNPVTTLALTQWQQAPAPQEQDTAYDTLEGGGVLWLPQLPFELRPEEQHLLSAEFTAAARAKNISLSADGQQLRGLACSEADMQLLRAMMWRFAAAARHLAGALMPSYTGALRPGRTSFRPAEIAGRQTSWRKDDTRLHVDSFPSSPTGGQRILRVFSNINPQQQPRSWRLGEPFEQVAQRFMPQLRSPLWGAGALLQALHITKQRRTAYDHYMLGLHDGMKADMAYQHAAEQCQHEFPAGTSWMVYTDQASHAATRGSHALEQTFLLPVQAMREPQRSPLRVLEGMLGRSLA
jgi:hypothetical protein